MALSKRLLIVLLGALNAVLLGALLLAGDSPRPAYGQVGGRSGEFVCVTAKVSGQTYDVLYMLDVSSRKLHAFFPAGARSPRLTAAPPRDLAKDFGRP